ncbi:MAG: hypothetical protein IJ710_11020 [Prevotella sp.]|nr:hypothetical protein [Prevotella sp.]
MNRFQLYLLLRRNRKLNEQRHPMFEQNRYAEVFTYIGSLIFIVYFIAIGTLMGWAARGGDYGIIFYILPFVLLLDFFFRFGLQQTPSVHVRPYLTLPVRHDAVIDCYLADVLLNGFNFIWHSLFLPYLFIAYCGGTPLWIAIALLVVLQLIIFINGLWYLLVRTLINENLLWWGLPILVYASIGLLYYLCADSKFDGFLRFADHYAFTLPAILLYGGLLAVLFGINRRVQKRYIYAEIAGKEKSSTLKHVSQLSALNRFGLAGEFLKLEVKSTMRNRAIRTRVIQGVVIITMLSLILAYDDIYDSPFLQSTWCLYCFAFFGAVNIGAIMGAEGNYIDLLMTHKENILTLLRAKYYYFCAITLLPLLLLLPPVISGKFSFLMVTSYLLLTTGPVYCLLFQAAVYNRETLPLNAKLTAKTQKSNKMQMLISFAVFIIPIVFARICTILWGETTGHLLIAAVGLAVSLAHPLWLRNIYRRLMRRRYYNIEGFHSS